MALEGNDLAILTARFGCARFGASRFGFVPCPEDVAGAGFDEPGEYIWKETKPPVTEWTLVGEDCVCRDLCTLALGTITVDADPIMDDGDVTASVTLSGVLGDITGIVRINWGDGRHDESQESPLVNGQLDFTGHYHFVGDYTITITVTDERGCEVEATLPVTVVPSMTVSATAQQVEGGGSGEAMIHFTYTVTGGTAPYFYDVTWIEGGGGTEGGLDPTITVSGTPETFEVISYTVTVTDNLGVIATFDGTKSVFYNA